MFTTGEDVSWVNEDGSRHRGAILARVEGPRLEATGYWQVIVAKEYRSWPVYSDYVRKYGVVTRHVAHHLMKLVEPEMA